MTPFQRDIDSLLYNIHNNIKCTICYFFGHKFSKYKRNYSTYSRVTRKCNRCGGYDHDCIGNINRCDLIGEDK